MGPIRRKMTVMSLISIFACLLLLTYAADAGAQHGGGMMMGSCGMCQKGPGMMSMMGGAGHGTKHASSGSLMKMLHQWGQNLMTQSGQLGITEKQMGEIESILMSHMKYAIRKKADGKVLLLEIQELLLKEQINLKAVEKKLKAMETLNTDMAMEGVETLQKALAVLTPEQQKKVRGLFKKSTFMRTMGMGMMPGGMMGSGMMKGMMGEGGMMPGMMGQGGMMPGMMGQGGAAAPAEGKKKSEHEH